MVDDHVLVTSRQGPLSLAFPDRHRGARSSRTCWSSPSQAWALRSAGMAAAPQIIAHFIAPEKHRNYKYLK
ncbi:hypothetical protein ACVW0I_002269 [Bradyrhizobium sp. LM6.11]